MNFNVAGGLATYDFYSQYVELAARMFGGYMNYTYNSVTKKIQLIRDPKGTGENVLLWTYNLKPEINLLSDFQISQWIKDYMVANSKMIIGEAREKFGSIAGPQGGGTLNGAAMKAEAKEANGCLGRPTQELCGCKSAAYLGNRLNTRLHIYQVLCYNNTWQT
jgi:hypothetical protein